MRIQSIPPSFFQVAAPLQVALKADTHRATAALASIQTSLARLENQIKDVVTSIDRNENKQKSEQGRVKESEETTQAVAQSIQNAVGRMTEIRRAVTFL